jgi:hypothetical protein
MWRIVSGYDYGLNMTAGIQKPLYLSTYLLPFLEQSVTNCPKFSLLVSQDEFEIPSRLNFSCQDFQTKFKVDKLVEIMDTLSYLTCPGFYITLTRPSETTAETSVYEFFCKMQYTARYLRELVHMKSQIAPVIASKLLYTGKTAVATLPTQENTSRKEEL